MILNSFDNALDKMKSFHLSEEIRTFFFKLIDFLIVFVIVVIMLFLLGLFIDYLRRDKYKVTKNYYRTFSNTVGSGEEYYYRYWLWQPNKKKYLRSVLERELNITRVHFRRAYKKKKYVKTKVVFLREAYGIAK